MEKSHVESPSVEIPVNHFRNIAHRLRYDEVDKFTLKPAKTFDWENLSQNPVYASLHDKFINMNWMGIVHINEKQVSESAVKEFCTGILTDSKGKDLYVHFCEKEVIITAMTLGQALNIEWLKGDSEPPEDFDVNEAWKKLNSHDEIFPKLRSERRLVKDDVKMNLLFIRNNIWFDQRLLIWKPTNRVSFVGLVTSSPLLEYDSEPSIMSIRISGKVVVLSLCHLLNNKITTTWKL
ncbi:hypothetical protein COLO4_33890 [Corchorus olitorius]|uniref:Uncharacterized protein n=1 Tax=Corchorus olitorius TaxID=93759 RepID=A0A1R3GQA9_9ROSI|nr:hypothetical protein COLO4_33890 [Corchorus olitorius]